MYTARPLLALLLLATLAGCDPVHERVYPTDNVSGRWFGTGAYGTGGTYDADLVFRQDGQNVNVNGTIHFTDANGALVETPYNLRATLRDHTLTFENGFGVATISEDGRSLQWLYGAGTAAYALTRR